MSFSLIRSPVDIKLFTDLKSLNEFLVLNNKEPAEESKTIAGSVYRDIIGGSVIVYIDKDQRKNSLKSTVLHEAVHAYCRIRDYMGIGFDEEVMAYGIESINDRLISLCHGQGMLFS